MTSPVERISGPSTESTMLPSRGAEPLERQHRLLDRDRRVERHVGAVARRQHPVALQLGDRTPRHDERGGLGERDAERLRHERHGPARPRVRLEHVEHAGPDRELHVEQAAHADPLGDLAGRLDDLALHVAAERHGRQGARRVAGMDAGLLDVLHDSADVQLGAVVERVDVDLERVVEEPVDQQRRAGADDRLLAHPVEVVLERRGVVDDLHAAAAEHVARPHEHRVADRLGDRRPPTARRSPCRCAGREARPRRGFARTRRVPPRGRSPRARFRGSARRPPPAPSRARARSGRRAARSRRPARRTATRRG